jgi:superfamily II DNA/RNA helicase
LAEISNEYQAGYAARVLIGGGGGGIEKLSAVLLDAQVDLNPHQIAAAVFAVSNPYSRGVLLADEVGLGKTIEAGIILAQKWAEGKRNIIIITPATLKTQWAEELSEKFYLPVEIWDSGQGIAHSEKDDINLSTIKIVSYNYAYIHESELRATKWDVAVFDEAHKLRNVYKGDNVMAESICKTFKDTYKLLLTATPLQNSLLELYGLANFIDDNLFGDIDTFKNNYVTHDNSEELAKRLKTICVRTLRKQVLQYIKYTDRYAITQEYEPGAAEEELHKSLTEYIYTKSRVMKKLPKQLIGIMLLKQLSSSPAALSSTLNKLKNTLVSALEHKANQITLDINDTENDEDLQTQFKINIDETEGLTEEIEQLSYLIDLAESITAPAKVAALDSALGAAFTNLKKTGAAEKAVIFTESRKTQDFLSSHLSRRYKKSEILTLNGSTKDRNAVINAFKESGKILIATEVGGEGLNLQFCSLVVNYDMPWNPQRIEQRIGRCHRYGQKHDVCVVNFLSKTNYADRRLYELLSQKFKLFTGVFGASDTVLGVLEDADFEKSVAAIYANCRTQKEIDEAFAELQTRLDEGIKRAKNAAKAKVFEYLDADVAARFKAIESEVATLLNKREQLLWNLTKYALSNKATIDDANLSFIMHKQQYNGKHTELIYHMDKSAPLSQRYRLNCPLAKEIMFAATYGTVHSSSITYDLAAGPKVSALLPYKGKRGTLALFSVYEKGGFMPTDFVLYGLCGDQPMDSELCEKLLMLTPKSVHRSYVETDSRGKEVYAEEMVREEKRDALVAAFDAHLPKYSENLHKAAEKYFEQQVKKLDSWAEDKRAKTERKLAPMQKRLLDTKTEASKEKNFTKKLAILDKIKQLEKELAAKRLSFYAELDDISAQRDALVETARTRLAVEYRGKIEFIYQWEIL